MGRGEDKDESTTRSAIRLNGGDRANFGSPGPKLARFFFVCFQTVEESRATNGPNFR